MAQPFFTIGITTYNRHDLLREALDSILAQSFTDFEVIVGNDYTAEVLSGELLGLADPRIRFVNHPRNLREVGNMNALLAMASGRYFTWLFDDDLYAPDFLLTAHEALVKTGLPPAFFSSYRVLKGTDGLQSKEILPRPIRLLTGREFLGGYFAGRLEINSTCGLFDTATLRSVVGGVEELCASAVGLYCEYLFLVRCALLGRIAYMDAPFVVFRAHAGSWGESNLELDKYREAGQELVRRCGEVLRQPSLSDDFNANLMGICKLHLVTFAYKSARFETARKRFGIGAAYRAMSRLPREAAKTRNAFTRGGGADGFNTALIFTLMQIKCCLLILGTLAVHWVRKYIPNFCK